MRAYRMHWLCLPLVLLAAGCATSTAVRSTIPPPEPQAAQHEMQVTATAFNSLSEQTDGDPSVTASGDRLRPGVRAIAVSRDLERMGLTPGTRVEIDGYGEWVVLDRMAPRWERKIDLYMGDDEAAALRFGKRTVRIRWTPK